MNGFNNYLRNMLGCIQGIRKKVVLRLTLRLWLREWNGMRSYSPTQRMLEEGPVWWRKSNLSSGHTEFEMPGRHPSLPGGHVDVKAHGSPRWRFKIGCFEDGN